MESSKIRIQIESSKIRIQIESSEIRIQTESIDLFLFHYNDTKFVKFMIDSWEKNKTLFENRMLSSIVATSAWNQ